jgi:hypothetical protein
MGKLHVEWRGFIQSNLHVGIMKISIQIKRIPFNPLILTQVLYFSLLTYI